MKRTILVLLFSFFCSVGYSQKYDVNLIKEKNEDLWSFVKDWLGTKYKFGGTTKSGIDCSGFTKVLYKYVFQVEIPRTAQLQYKKSDVVKEKDNLEKGDLGFFRTKSSPTSWHVGVYLDSGYFVHSGSRKTGVIISNLESNSYLKTYYGTGKINKDTTIYLEK